MARRMVSEHGEEHAYMPGTCERLKCTPATTIEARNKFHVATSIGADEMNNLARTLTGENGVTSFTINHPSDFTLTFERLSTGSFLIYIKEK